MIGSTLPPQMRGIPQAQALREFSTAALAALDRLRGDLETRALTPDHALDRLRETRDQLSGHLGALAGAAAREFSSETSEQQTMEKALRTERSRPVTEPTILATAYPAWTWFTVGSFQTGFHNGVGEVEQARASASSGGSTSGYSSGGSFSGAGSSSRF